MSLKLLKQERIKKCSKLQFREWPINVKNNANQIEEEEKYQQQIKNVQTSTMIQQIDSDDELFSEQVIWKEEDRASSPREQTQTGRNKYLKDKKIDSNSNIITQQKQSSNITKNSVVSKEDQNIVQLQCNSDPQMQNEIIPLRIHLQKHEFKTIALCRILAPKTNMLLYGDTKVYFLSYFDAETQNMNFLYNQKVDDELLREMFKNTYHYQLIEFLNVLSQMRIYAIKCSKSKLTTWIYYTKNRSYAELEAIEQQVENEKEDLPYVDYDFENEGFHVLKIKGIAIEM
eukprot:403344279